MINELEALETLIRRHDAHIADWLVDLIKLKDSDNGEFWRLINDNGIWGGAGSLADQFLVDNPGIPGERYSTEVREFRSLMIRIGKEIMNQNEYNPRVVGWVQTFESWN